MAQEPQRQFRNRCNHIIGVVVMDGGKRTGQPLGAGETVWLTEQEIDATTRAPRKPSDSPFADGTGPDGEGPALEEVTGSTRPLPPQQPEETGAAVPPQGEAAEGQFSPGEEAGTPEAPAAEHGTPPGAPTAA